MKNIYKSDKIKCQQEVRQAIKSGVLHRPSKCSKCGIEGKVQGHHEDYSKPLEVTWLCIKCHRNLHKKPNNRPKLDKRAMQLRLIDNDFKALFENCTYNVACQWDDMRQKYQHLIKFYNPQGFIVYSVKYYLNFNNLA